MYRILKFNNQPLLQKINKKNKTGAEHVTLVYPEYHVPWPLGLVIYQKPKLVGPQWHRGKGLHCDYSILTAFKHPWRYFHIYNLFKPPFFFSLLLG